MQTWARRGLQTALLTGGALMLGTGIASAEEDVSPDRPASPLDGSLAVPIHVDNNALGTPMGQQDLPRVDHELRVSPGDLTGDLPTVAIPGGSDDPFLGNRVNGDVVVPVDVSGNALATWGRAEVVNQSEQQVATSRPVVTDGGDAWLAGNVVDLDHAVPVQVTGNAAGLLGTAESTNTARQTSSATGDLITDGTGGALSGNLLAGQSATPVEVNGNAVSGAGTAQANSRTSTEASSGGALLTGGADSTGSGATAGVPVAVPVALNGTALTGVGHAEANSDSVTTAHAGRDREGLYGVPTYLQTNGESAVLAGSVVQPAASGPLSTCGNAGGLAGTAAAHCSADETTSAGGGNRSNGVESMASGTIAHAPLTMPGGVNGNTLAGLGAADAAADTVVASGAGGDAYTRGHGGLGSGTALASPAGLPTDLACTSAATLGSSHSDCVNDVDTAAGGYTGTTGDDSLVGGNAAATPVALPVEGVANGAAAFGRAHTTAAEQKSVRAGGKGNTEDDAGVLAANLVHLPVAGATQAFGNGAVVAGRTDAGVDAATETEAGGDSRAKGEGGLVAGNITQAPVSLPAQVFGNGATAAGNGHSVSSTETSTSAGGDAVTDGSDGFGTGNVVSMPTASAGHVLSQSAAVLGRNHTRAVNVTDTTAGGDTETVGERGTIAGNLISSQNMPLVQTFGMATSAVSGKSTASAENTTSANSGGAVETSGDHGTLSGNLLDVPAATVVQPHGVATALLDSRSRALSTNDTSGTVGGVSSTDGDLSALSGVDTAAPLAVNTPIYDVPVEVLARAFTQSTNRSDIEVGEGSGFDPWAPDAGLGMGAAELPALPTGPARCGTGTGDPLHHLLRGLFGGSGQLADLSELTGTISGSLAGGAPDDEMHTLPAGPARAGNGASLAGLFGYQPVG